MALVVKAPAHDALPSVETAFEGQLEHVPSPTDGLKVPAAHAWHAPALDLVYPTLHWLHAPVTLPAAVVVLAGHGAAVHACVPAAPLNVPAGHSAPAADDDPAAQKLPAAAVQLCLSLAPPTQ